jgi:hypothetical protein
MVTAVKNRLYPHEIAIRQAHEHIADDFQNLGLHVHTSVRNQLLVVLSSQVPEVVSGLRVIDDREEWDEDLIQARLDGTINQFFQTALTLLEDQPKRELHLSVRPLR